MTSKWFENFHRNLHNEVNHLMQVTKTFFFLNQILRKKDLKHHKTLNPD
jgi:hypothetical protein